MSFTELKSFINEQTKLINKNISEFKEYVASQLNEIKGNVVSLRENVKTNRDSIKDFQAATHYEGNESDEQKKTISSLSEYFQGHIQA